MEELVGCPLVSLLFFELLVDLLGCSPLPRELLRSPACDRSSVAEERYREGKCRKLGQHPLAEGQVLIRDRQAKPQCVGRGITNEQHPAFPWPQKGHLACTVPRRMPDTKVASSLDTCCSKMAGSYRSSNVGGVRSRSQASPGL